jgi:hypothetical protein
MSTHARILAVVLTACILPACDRKPEPTAGNAAGDTSPPATSPSADQPAAPSEIPLLPLAKGDFWRYQVGVEVTAPNQPAGAPESKTHQSTRTYLGKLKPAPEKPEVDVFEVVIPNSPTERELVEIYPDRILMRGSIRLTPGEEPKLMWLDPPVPFVLSHIRPGSSLPSLTVAQGETSRGISVVGREDVTVPAGTFRAIRLLMTGKDSGLEMRRTIWFAPGIGIVRDQTARYTADTLLFRQTQELVETNKRRD